MADWTREVVVKTGTCGICPVCDEVIESPNLRNPIRFIRDTRWDGAIRYYHLDCAPEAPGGRYVVRDEPKGER